MKIAIQQSKIKCLVWTAKKSIENRMANANGIMQLVLNIDLELNRSQSNETKHSITLFLLVNFHIELKLHENGCNSQ